MNNDNTPINCRKKYQQQQNVLSFLAHKINSKLDNNYFSPVMHGPKKAKVIQNKNVIFAGTFQQVHDYLLDLAA